MTDNPLHDQRVDRVVAIARGVIGAIPIVGAMAAEALTEFIPGQKLERLESWVHAFSERVSAVEGGVERLRDRLATGAGADILEDGAVQASRALSDERRGRLANLLANGLAGPEFEHDRMKTLVRLFSQLTDSELVLLTFYSKPPTMGSAWHKTMTERHPDILRPVSREVGRPQADTDRAALQDHHKETLSRLGLLKTEGGPASVTPLGRLLVRYILDAEELDSAS